MRGGKFAGKALWGLSHWFARWCGNCERTMAEPNGKGEINSSPHLQIVLRCVVTILVAEEGLPGQYEVCRKKMIGWFAGEILLPERPSSAIQL